MREQMKSLDDLEMGDLWSEARERTPRLHPEPPTPRGPVSSRITAGVVAFAVFIAAGVFVWQAFRPGATSIQPSGDGVAGIALWPERTAADLAQTQALADSGDPTVAWRLDPKEVATHFAEYILEWGKPVDDSGGVHYAVTLDSGWSPDDSSAVVGVGHLAIPCPTPPPSVGATCPPPYDGETLTLRQLGVTGQAGVWSVTSVTASGLTLDLKAGETLTNPTQLNGSVTFPDTWRSVAGFHAETGFRVGTGPGCNQAQANATQEGDGPLLNVSVDPSTCDETSPAGYGWIATGTQITLPLLDAPFDLLEPSGDQPSPRFFGLTVVPFTLSLDAAEAESSTPTPTATSSITSTTYTDPRGWTMQVPSTWSSQQAPMTLYGSGGSGQEFRGDGLVLDIYTGTVITIPANDSTLSLDAGTLLQQTDTGWQGTFEFDGLAWTVALRTEDGSSALTQTQSEAIANMIASIAFPSWHLGDTRNGWTALFPTPNDNPAERQAKISWSICDKVGCYVLAYGNDPPMLLGPIKTCGEGENMTADPSSPYPIVLECPNDPTQLWTIKGQPAPTNMAGDDQQLETHPVIVAWDGTLLTNPGETIHSG